MSCTAAMPLEVANEAIPPSNFAKDSSNAERVGFFVLV